MSSTTATPAECLVTFLVIGKNEEQFIGEVLSRIFKAAESLPSYEVIFVDSASTDRTVEIVKQFNVQIYQLRKEWKMTPSAGRFIGSQFVQGKYIFFVDGDSFIEPPFVAKALAFLEQHPEYGGVAGYLDEAYYSKEGEKINGFHNYFQQDLERESADFPTLGGSAFYRWAAIEQAGTFNPYVPAGEEEELCLRIRRQGWKLARINTFMSTKNTEERNSFYEIFRRVKTSMYDYGTTIRHASVYGCGWEYAWKLQRFVMTTLVGFVGLLILIGVAIYFQVWYLGLLVAASLVVAFMARKGGFKKGLLSMAVRLASTYCTVRSWLLTRAKRVEDYPTDAIRIQ